MTSAGNPTIAPDPRALRRAYGCFPTGVTIMTARSRSGDNLGMTVSSFNTVSLEPPLILFSVLKSANAFSIWMDVSEFCVNVLSETQGDLSSRFATPLTDKWKDVEWREATAISAPVIEHCVFNFECSVWNRFEGGDHTIIVGKVLGAYATTVEKPEPLVFCAGRYRRLEREADQQSLPHSHEWLLGW